MLEKYIYINYIILSLLIIDNSYLFARINRYEANSLRCFNGNGIDSNILLNSTNHLKINDKRDSISQRKNTNYQIPSNKYDPSMALMFSIIPGFFLHGAGHFYAERYGTAILLLSIEALSISFFAGSAFIAWGSENEEETFYGIVIASGILFLGTWIYDMVMAPKICEKERQKLKRISIKPSVQKMYIGNKIGLKLCYNF